MHQQILLSLVVETNQVTDRPVTKILAQKLSIIGETLKALCFIGSLHVGNTAKFQCITPVKL